MEERLGERDSQIEHLTLQHARLFDEIEKLTPVPAQTTDAESQTEDRQHEKLVQVNTKLKRALQAIKEKVHRVASERPELFDGVGEETTERLDHLIATLDSQATQLHMLRADRERLEPLLHDKRNELQRYSPCPHEVCVPTAVFTHFQHFRNVPRRASSLLCSSYFSGR